MTAYYIEKKNDKEAAWNIIQACKPPNMISRSDFEECFDTQNQELYQVNKNKIKEKAELWAKSFINSHNADDYIYLYRAGGLYFFTPYD